MAEITKKPAGKVTSMKIERSGNEFTGSWKIPSKANNDSNNARWLKVQLKWQLDVGKDGGKRDPIDWDGKKQLDVTTNKQTYSEFKGTWGSIWKGKKLDRKAFYPCVQKSGGKDEGFGKKVNDLTLYVRGINTYKYDKYKDKKGKIHYRKQATGYGAWASVVFKFEKPDPPTITLDYDASRQQLNYRIKTPEGKGAKERYDTNYCVIYEVYNPTTKKWGKAKTAKAWTATASTDLSGVVDVDSIGQGEGVNFAAGWQIKITVKAYARGIAGDNPAKDKAVAKSQTIAYPASCKINSVTCGSKAAGGRVVIDVKQPSGSGIAFRSNYEVKLQRAKNQDPSVTKNSIPEGDWQDVEGAVNDGDVEYFYDLWEAARSNDGSYTWYRTKATLYNFVQNSAPVKAECIFKKLVPPPSAANDKAFVHSLSAVDNGTGIKAVIGWKTVPASEENLPGYGTELSWSADVNAWESTKRPNTFDFTWKDVSPAASQYTGSGTVYIKDLTDGQMYYVRARKFLEGETTTYGPYSAISSITPHSIPEAVEIFAPQVVRRGEAIECSWTYESELVQKSWILGVTNTATGKTRKLTGRDAKGFCSIPASEYGTSTECELWVEVSTGGSYRRSNLIKTVIADPPTCQAAAAPIVAQPASFEVYSSSNNASIICSIKSVGIQYAKPDGDGVQLEGEVVYTNATAPQAAEWTTTPWSETLYYAQKVAARATLAQALVAAQEALEQTDPLDEEAYQRALSEVDNAQQDITDNEELIASLTGTCNMSRIVLPSGIDFIDQGTYDYEVSVIDSDTQLASETFTCSANVDWAHQALGPSDAISIQVNEEERSAQITLQPFEGSVETDRYELYRKVPGGYVKCADNLPLNAVVTDLYVPFSKDTELAYRVCTKTTDGDFAYGDYEYELKLSTLRFDWNGDFVEMPFDLQLSNRSQKSFESRAHFGQIEEEGYWDSAINRTANYRSNTFKTSNAELLARLERLSSHPGSCFCRTRDGQAFECNVDVSTDMDYDTEKVSVSLDVTKVKLTRAYMLSNADIEGGIDDDTPEEPEEQEQ